MKQTLYILIITTSIGCNEKIVYDEINEITNQIILDQYREIGLGIIIDLDSIPIVDSFIIDPCAYNGFFIDTNQSKILLFNNDYALSSRRFDRYFTNDDIDTLIAQIENKKNLCWDKNQFPKAHFNDSTINTGDSIGGPNLTIWLKFKENPYNLLNISKPLFNKNHNIAIVSTELFLKDYYLSSIVELFKSGNNMWFPKSKNIMIFKLWVIDQPVDGKYTIGNQAIGTYESYPFENQNR